MSVLLVRLLPERDHRFHQKVGNYHAHQEVDKVWQDGKLARQFRMLFIIKYGA